LQVQDSHNFRVIKADLHQDIYANAVLKLVDAYARDPLGKGEPLDSSVLARLIPGLQEHPACRTFLCFDANQAIGLAVCFIGFSTFIAKPVMYIHDLAVLSDWRSQGISQLLLDAIEQEARSLNCCKIALEIREDHPAIQKIYTSLGFVEPGLRHCFWQKVL